MKRVLSLSISLSYICLVQSAMVERDSLVVDRAAAVLYDENCDPQYDTAFKHLKEIDLKAYKSILDLYCKNGRITAAMAGMAPDSEVEGIDHLPDMLTLAREKYGHLGNVTFGEVEDVTNFRSTKCYDLITCFNNTHRFKSPETLFSSITRALNPRGFFLTTGVVGFAEHPLAQPCKDLAQHPPFDKLLQDFKPENLFYPYEEDSMRAVMHSSGLIPIRIQRIRRSLTFGSADTLKVWLLGWFKTMVPFSRLPHEYQQAFAKALVERHILYEKPHPDGSVDYTSTYIAALAQKPAE